MSTPKAWPGRLALLLAFLWIAAISLGSQFRSWIWPAINPAPRPLPLALTASMLQVVLLAVPLALLLLLVKHPRHRAVLQSWLWGTAMLALLAFPRLLPPTAGQTILMVQALMLIFFNRLMSRLGAPPTRLTEFYGLPTALTLAALFVLPWVPGGALGSGLDALLALAVGFGFALTTADILRRTWLRTLEQESRGPARDLFTGGWVIGTLLLIMASGIGFNGLPLNLMTALPAWGWAVMALAGVGQSRATGRNWPALCAFLWPAVAAPLLLWDLDGLLLEAQDPILLDAWQATAAVVVIGWVVAVILLIAARSLGGWRARRPAFITGAGAWATVAALFAITATPGWHGDRLLVIMATQADVTAAADIQDYDARRRTVYTTLTEEARSSQAGLRRTLDRLGYRYQPYYLVNAIEVEGGLVTKWWLSMRDDVDRVLPSPVLRPVGAPLSVATGSAAGPSQPPWNLTNIGAARVWSELGVTGAGIVVGQSDSGVQGDHPELADGYRGRVEGDDYNWFDPWLGSSAPEDHGGHGTHTLGSAVGNRVGVAPDATWIGCTNLARNLGNAARYLDCWQFMLAPFPLGGDPFTAGDPTRSAHVTNNSWGCPEDAEGCDPESLHPAVKAMRAAGIFMVVSAGNSGPTCHTVDAVAAIYDEVFSVGAVDQENDLAAFSSTGPVLVDGSFRTKPDIVAPGVDVLSAYPGDSYELASGTSMAGPHVAGVVALIWSANPALIGDIDRTEHILIETAQPFAGGIDWGLSAEEEEQLTALDGEENLLLTLLTGDRQNSCWATSDLEARPNNIAGYGTVDAYAAVQRALEMAVTQP